MTRKQRPIRGALSFARSLTKKWRFQHERLKSSGLSNYFFNLDLFFLRHSFLKKFLALGSSLFANQQPATRNFSPRRNEGPRSICICFSPPLVRLWSAKGGLHAFFKQPETSFPTRKFSTTKLTKAHEVFVFIKNIFFVFLGALRGETFFPP